MIYAFIAFQQPYKLQKHCCLYFYPPNIVKPMYIEQLREMDPPPNRVCNQIILLILYYIRSRSVTLLRVIDAPKQKSVIFFILLLLISSSILAFEYSFLLFLECLLASCLTLSRLSTLLVFGSCNHCILAFFL